MRLKRTKRRQIMFLVRKGEGPKAQVLVHWALLGPRMGLVLGEAGRLDGLRKSSGPQTGKHEWQACVRRPRAQPRLVRGAPMVDGAPLAGCG